MVKQAIKKLPEDFVYSFFNYVFGAITGLISLYLGVVIASTNAEFGLLEFVLFIFNVVVFYFTFKMQTNFGGLFALIVQVIRK
jgi:hypothetical protein